MLLLFGQSVMRAQQPGPPQNDPYYGQYPANQPPGYGQPPYTQPQPYQQQQSYPQQPYQQPYPQQPYQQPYQQPQTYPQQPYQQPYSQQDYGQAAPQGQPLDAEQLEQLVAPIALYPDALVAQILAAATYPAQVAAADRWLQGMQAQGYASAGQVAAGADAQAWDPSVKALTAFPQVLAEMDRNLQWTTDLGNAYYNQPQDVLQTVQVMRQRAQSAGNLESTPQEAVSDNQGYIEVAPQNQQEVYVPQYDPWSAYGQPVSPYPGFSLVGELGSLLGSSGVRYGLGIAMGAFTHTSWGWLGWGLDWLTQSVLFQGSNYASQSNSVANWGYGGGGGPGGGSRGYPDQGRGWGNGRGNSGWQQGNYGQQGGGYIGRPGGGPVRMPDRYAERRPAEAYQRDYRAQGGGYGGWQQGYNRQQQPVRPRPFAGEQQYGRPGYGSGFYGRSGTEQGYSGRPSAGYGYRPPSESGQRGGFGQQRSSHDFAGSYGKPKGSGGFHLFGGGHSSRGFSGGGHAPKGFGGGKHSGGGGHGGGHSGGKHHR